MPLSGRTRIQDVVRQTTGSMPPSVRGDRALARSTDERSRAAHAEDVGSDPAETPPDGSASRRLGPARCDRRQAAGENLWITCRARVRRGAFSTPGSARPRRSRGRGGAYRRCEPGLSTVFPLLNKGALSSVKFFGIMALTWDLSRLSTKVGPAFDEDDGEVTPSPSREEEKAGTPRTPSTLRRWRGTACETARSRATAARPEVDVRETQVSGGGSA